MSGLVLPSRTGRENVKGVAVIDDGVAAGIDISESPSGGVGVRDPYIVKGGGQRSLDTTIPWRTQGYALYPETSEDYRSK
jgi:hypothetical protein